jgi:hypothetical protein
VDDEWRTNNGNGQDAATLTEDILQLALIETLLQAYGLVGNKNQKRKKISLLLWCHKNIF